MNTAFAGCGIVGVELAEAAGDIIGFEVEAFDIVIMAAAFDGGPFDDAGGSGPEGIAHVGLLEDFLRTGAGLAGGNELGGSEVLILRAIDDVEEAEFDGVGEGDLEI